MQRTIQALESLFTKNCSDAYPYGVDSNYSRIVETLTNTVTDRGNINLATGNYFIRSKTITDY